MAGWHYRALRGQTHFARAYFFQLLALIGFPLVAETLAMTDDKPAWGLSISGSTCIPKGLGQRAWLNHLFLQQHLTIRLSGQIKNEDSS
jgi:hypothetical protein